ncbi:hypothetical protein BC6307_05440 [Sutcliffiella cohnii]|uniref:Uncharacterized protein n=1 Tax=Sutcliffiella cohnii TaxID=33932 RepID=A0A223KN31_9BACI|nr:hypothetical protein [Sutcliffiella cohnii]AST90764.1 hypothetical protein BC6307_05440 [Sutcliffiella cohnii]
MKTRMLLLGVAIIPWFSVPLMGKQSFKRFFPMSLFMGILIIGETLLAHKYCWWKIHKRPHKKVVGEIPLIIGPYIVGSLWMLKLGYGNILRFSFLNLSTHLFIVYKVMKWLKKIRYWTLVNMNSFQFLSLFVMEAFILYIGQFLYDKMRGIKS